LVEAGVSGIRARVRVRPWICIGSCIRVRPGVCSTLGVRACVRVRAFDPANEVWDGALRWDINNTPNDTINAAATVERDLLRRTPAGPFALGVGVCGELAHEQQSGSVGIVFKVHQTQEGVWNPGFARFIAVYGEGDDLIIGVARDRQRAGVRRIDIRAASVFQP
jgi:hypothetical protein